MANRITVNICGEDYTLVAEENTAYMEQVASLVDKKMTEIIAGAKVGRGDAAVLAAVNLADELLKSEQTAENLRRQVKSSTRPSSRAGSNGASLPCRVSGGPAGRRAKRGRCRVHGPGQLQCPPQRPKFYR